MFLWLIGLTAHADVPSVDDPTLNIEEKNPLIYRVVIQDNHEVGSIFRLKDPIFHGMRWSNGANFRHFGDYVLPSQLEVHKHHGDLLQHRSFGETPFGNMFRFIEPIVQLDRTAVLQTFIAQRTQSWNS